MRNTITRAGIGLAVLGAVTGALVGALVSAGPASAGDDKPLLLIYGSTDSGVQITKPREVVHRLGGAPASFQAFARAEVRHLQAVNDCDPAYVGIGVARVRTDGFARGSVNECGGYQAIWRQVDGRWREVIGTQDIWTCAELRRNQIPVSVVRPHARCAAGKQVVPYRG